MCLIFLIYIAFISFMLQMIQYSKSSSILYIPYIKQLHIYIAQLIEAPLSKLKYRFKIRLRSLKRIPISSSCCN